MSLCVFENRGVLNLEPLTLTRPAFDLLCGASTLLDRQRPRFGGRGNGRSGAAGLGRVVPAPAA